MIKNEVLGPLRWRESGISKCSEMSRQPFLQSDEVPRFFTSLVEEEPLIRDHFSDIKLPMLDLVSLKTAAWLKTIGYPDHAASHITYREDA
jgi:hypothetical protein